MTSSSEQIDTVDKVNGTPAPQAAFAACTSPRRAHMPEIPTGPRTRAAPAACQTESCSGRYARHRAIRAVRAPRPASRAGFGRASFRGSPAIEIGRRESATAGAGAARRKSSNPGSSRHRNGSIGTQQALVPAVPASTPWNGIDSQRIAAATSAALLIPGMTETTRRMRQGNAARSCGHGHAMPRTTAPIESTRAMMSAGARP